MEDNIPNNIFIDDVLTSQINRIVAFRNELKGKYQNVFDNEEMYIALDFEMIPAYRATDGLTHLSFVPHYSEKLPPHIKDEFENYLRPHLIK